MGQKVIDFFENWLTEHIPVEDYAEEGKTDPRVAPLLAQLLTAAKGNGISAQELEDNCGDLKDRIAAALEEATDDEVERQAGGVQQGS